MHEGHAVQIFVVHGHSGDLVVIVGRVVIDTCIGVHSPFGVRFFAALLYAVRVELFLGQIGEFMVY